MTPAGEKRRSASPALRARVLKRFTSPKRPPVLVWVLLALALVTLALLLGPVLLVEHLRPRTTSPTLTTPGRIDYHRGAQRVHPRQHQARSAHAHELYDPVTQEGAPVPASPVLFPRLTSELGPPLETTVQAALIVLGRRADGRGQTWYHRRADLTYADLLRADLSLADLAGSDLTGADLTGANLIRANLIRANLNGVNLAGADLSGADLTRADLVHANLTRASLAYANLAGGLSVRTGADFTDANLADADLTRANLKGVDLTRADLTGANLTGANLTGAYVARTTSSSRTRWPEGFTPPPPDGTDPTARLGRRSPP